ncbi:MAG: hypothetical protein IVW57_03765 [Ktedonobacterales bacterium]|nr:hypothetical protein [Ktedonobacterales bacterium]
MVEQRERDSLEDVPPADAPEGEAVLGLALFTAGGTWWQAESAGQAWARQWALWLALAVAAAARLWRLEATPLSLAVALANTLAVSVTYRFALRAFGRGVAGIAATLLAVSGLAVAAGRLATPLGFVPPLLALWALALFAAVAANGQRRWLLAGCVPLGLAVALLPLASMLSLVSLAALVLVPTVPTTHRPPDRCAPARGPVGSLLYVLQPRQNGRAPVAVALILLVAAGLAWSTTRQARPVGAIDAIAAAHLMGDPLLPPLLVATVAAGWLALVALVAAPIRDLWRWYALASDPHERWRAVWAGLRGDARWRARALLALTVTLLTVTLLTVTLLAGALLVPPRSASALLTLLPIALLLPALPAEWLRTRGSKRLLLATALWLALVVLLVAALALATASGIAASP